MCCQPCHITDNCAFILSDLATSNNAPSTCTVSFEFTHTWHCNYLQFYHWYGQEKYEEALKVFLDVAKRLVHFWVLLRA